jgi:hypothetical protein
MPQTIVIERGNESEFFYEREGKGYYTPAKT